MAKTRITCLLLASALVAAGAGAAQTPVAPGAATPPAAAPPRPPQVVSPEVRADRTITFRLRAPNAQQVTLIGELDGRTYPMSKGADGVWTVTVGPWAPDVYNYQFNVDGVIAMDPVNPSVKLGFGAFPPANLVEVPGDSLLFYDARNVPHGTVRMETYHSTALGGAPRTVWIYTPPGYETSNERYPVFYLLHGSGNIDSSWMLTGRANLIMDNLIASGRSRPMIIVNPFGYARPGVGLGPEVTPAPGATPAAAPAGGGMGGAAQATSGFARDLLQDVIPFVERKFRTLPGADNRALGGLSMGGGQTVSIGFSNPDVFHSLVVMSAGGTNTRQNFPAFYANPAETNAKMKLIWIATGRDDNLVNNSVRTLVDDLTAGGIEHSFKFTEGRHEWVVWRHHLNEVAPLLFR